MFHKSDCYYRQKKTKTYDAGTPHSKSGLNCLSVQQSVPIQIEMMLTIGKSEFAALEDVWWMFGCLDVWYGLDVWWMFGLVWMFGGCLAALLWCANLFQ